MDRGNKGRPLWLLWDASILTVAIGTVGSGGRESLFSYRRDLSMGPDTQGF